MLQQVKARHKDERTAARRAALLPRIQAAFEPGPVDSRLVDAIKSEVHSSTEPALLDAPLHWLCDLVTQAAPLHLVESSEAQPLVRSRCCDGS